MIGKMILNAFIQSFCSLNLCDSEYTGERFLLSSLYLGVLGTCLSNVLGKLFAAFVSGKRLSVCYWEDIS